MAERSSPLLGAEKVPGLSQRHGWSLTQYHAWPDRYARMAAAVGVAMPPAPGKAMNGARGALLRIHPQRLWLVSPQGVDVPGIGPEDGASLDLSYARIMISVEAGTAPELLSRFVAIDLRPDRFAIDDIALTSLHRVPVVLWRRAEGVDILAPRSFARTVWDVLAEALARL